MLNSFYSYIDFGGLPFTICMKYGFLVPFRRFWTAQSSPATEILHSGLIGFENDYNNKELESGYSFWLKTS
jgi:hypothetical protein